MNEKNEKNQNNHVLDYEKMLLIISLRYTSFLEKGLDFNPNSNVKPSRPFERLRLKQYFSKSNKTFDHAEFNDEYRKGLFFARNGYYPV